MDQEQLIFKDLIFKDWNSVYGIMFERDCLWIYACE